MHADPRESEPAEGEVRVEDPAVETPEDLRVEELLQTEFDAPELAQAVEEQEPADAAETLERLEEGEAADVLEEMGTESAADALAHMLPALGVSVLEDLIEEDPAYAGQLIEEMAPDDATELLRELPDGYRDRLLGTLGKVEAVKYRRLLDYGEHTAGGLMNSDYLHLRDTQSVAEAIEIVRRAETEDEASRSTSSTGQASCSGRRRCGGCCSPGPTSGSPRSWRAPSTRCSPNSTARASPRSSASTTT